MSVVFWRAALSAPMKNRLPTQKTTGVVRKKRTIRSGCRGIPIRNGNQCCMEPRKMTPLRTIPTAKRVLRSLISFSRAAPIGSSRVSSGIPRKSYP